MSYDSPPSLGDPLSRTEAQVISREKRPSDSSSPEGPDRAPRKVPSLPLQPVTSPINGTATVSRKKSKHSRDDDRATVSPETPTQIQIIDCLEWRHHPVRGEPGKYDKYSLPMCLDCFAVCNKPGSKIFPIRHRGPGTSCRFRGADLRRLTVDTMSKAKRAVTVQSVVTEQDKLLANYDVKRFQTFSGDENTSKLDLESRKYILEKTYRPLESNVKQEDEFLYDWARKGNPGEVALKTPSDGFRESCDVCQTSIFDLHLLCQYCAFTVCLDCYADREENGDIRRNTGWYYDDEHSAELLSQLPRDGFHWLPCCSNPQDSLPKGKISVEKLAVGRWKHSLIPVRVIPRIVMSQLLDDAVHFVKKLGPTTTAEPSETDRPRLLCKDKVLWLMDSQADLTPTDMAIFRRHWAESLPVLVSRISSALDPNLWLPETFCRKFGPKSVKLVDCSTQPHTEYPDKHHCDFWDGFENFDVRFMKEDGTRAVWKIKDWPSKASFSKVLPLNFQDLMRNLPINSYTNHRGPFNLASNLPAWCNPPDLGPKMYAAYGSSAHPQLATTNLHVDISDAVNVIVYVGVPTGDGAQEAKECVTQALSRLHLDQDVTDRLNAGEVPGAIWQIYHPDDAKSLRRFIQKIRQERGIHCDDDPIHCQLEYLDFDMRKRLELEYGVCGMDIVQFDGDGIFIPASAPHQVWNLYSCIKVAEDFVTPEKVGECVFLTKEFRKLPNGYSNKADKLQIKNIVFHTVKNIVATMKQDGLFGNDPDMRD